MKVVFSSTSHIKARESVMFDCCRALLLTRLDDLMDPALFPGVEHVSSHLYYLNDGDKVLPPVKVFKRKATVYLNLTIYEGEFGARLPETDDFAREPVLRVVTDLYQSALHRAAERAHGKAESLGPALARIDAFFDDFRPEDSQRYREQPPAPSQKFWLDTSKYSF